MPLLSLNYVLLQVGWGNDMKKEKAPISSVSNAWYLNKDKAWASRFYSTPPQKKKKKILASYIQRKN